MSEAVVKELLLKYLELEGKQPTGLAKLS